MKNLDISTLKEAECNPDDGTLQFSCASCGFNIDVAEILRKYGPEGCYILADRLKKAADDDINAAMSETWATD